MEAAAVVLIGIVVSAVCWVLIRRDHRDLEYLKAGYIPPAWKSAYRRDHGDSIQEGQPGAH
ncbi:hypothetical protein [Mycobacterium xenopi]|uniref:hypothetical protein n=1 Tax=Mycobacterium xenopi TaxID=1789 RepID=UPI000A15E186|nr:hypothetical protein [Mycobacterium xenopi]ORX13058.1 hypothetical protein AWC32_15630 [Mycobacterium xenopi]SPX94948.1 Uncharacterised protein [Mycobacterium xenopi]